MAISNCTCPRSCLFTVSIIGSRPLQQLIWHPADSSWTPLVYIWQKCDWCQLQWKVRSKWGRIRGFARQWFVVGPMLTANLPLWLVSVTRLLIVRAWKSSIFTFYYFRDRGLVIIGSTTQWFRLLGGRLGWCGIHKQTRTVERLGWSRPKQKTRERRC